MPNFHYTFPVKVIDQPNMDGEHDVRVIPKQYDYAVDDEVYWKLVAKEYINDWFPTTFEQLSPFQQDWMLAEAIELCLTQDYIGVYDEQIHEKLLEQAWKYFCETQTRRDKYLYEDTSIEIIKAMNGYNADCTVKRLIVEGEV